MLSLIAQRDVGEMPEFKLQQSVAGGDEATLCGYAVRNSMGYAWFNGSGYMLRPARFYRLIYRRGKHGSGGTVPAASTRPHDDTEVDAEREEHRLLATEDSRRRYGMGND